MQGIFGLLRLIAGRARAMPGLLGVRIVGTLLAATLVGGVSLYSVAMGDAMLRSYLARDLYNTSYVGTSYIALGDALKPLSPAAYGALDRYVRRQQAADLALPLDTPYAHHYTTSAPLYHATNGGAPGGSSQTTLPIEYYDNLARQVTLVSGSLQPLTRGSDVPVAIPLAAARALRLTLGDRLVLSNDGRTALTPPLRVTAVFQPRDPHADFWSINTAQPITQSLVMLRPADFPRVVTAPTFSPTYFWRYHVHLTSIHLADADTLVSNLQRARNRVGAIAQGAEVHSWLDQDINGFQFSYGLLPVILYVLVAPIVLLVLYAIVVTTALVLERQGREIVLMRSRGATRRQVFVMYLVEGALIGLGATICGAVLGLPLAQFIGSSVGFVCFGVGLPITLSISTTTLLSTAATAALGMLAGLWPAMSLTRHSVTTYKARGARPRRGPMWAHLALDGVVLALALYGYSVLRRQGPSSAGAGISAIAQDPLLGIAPLLFAVAVTLVLSHLLPYVATASAAATDRLASPALRVALQSIARAPRQPMQLVQLLTLTLTMGVFAATVAGVEESNVADQRHYEAGSTVRLIECRIGVEPGKVVGLTVPVAWHQALPGAQGVSPALRLESGDPCGGSAAGQDNTTEGGDPVSVLGVDPTTAASAFWFRADFAPESWATMLSYLSRSGPRALVSRTFLAKTGLHQGDAFTIGLTTGATLHATVAAVADYFPTLDPTATGKPFVVTNLNYLVRASGRPGPNEMWIKTAESPSAVSSLLTAAHQRPSTLSQIIPYSGVSAPFSAADNPFQAGIYGVVSLGFLMAIVLSLLGFFAYAYLSLQRRLPEFAIVRALGLSAGGLRWLLLCEQFFVLGAGILGGIVAGVLTTVLFLPYLPIAQNTVPPYLVIVPWTTVETFAGAVLLVFVLVLSAHASMVLRASLGRVLRLGEA